MDTSKLRKFASFARSALIEQVGNRLKTVLAEKSLARRESPKVVEELEKRIKDLGERRVLETVAYTWFNRFCALRYMDVNRYTYIGILSPADGQFQPEILAEAKLGHIDADLVPEATRKQVMRLLDGSDKSADPQGEAYRLLLVAVCNYYHALMPFMFEKITDYTELLLPDDLLSGTSIPAYTREALLPINCSPEHTEESVEVIGWLYQFYIADKKDEVFEGLKKNKKITAENIPAATQLFTPHWIVRYLVENSLGRLWMLNHPNSKLIELMDYYVKPDVPETDFLKISHPEEIKICDPACGSGHMLTYAFDLLYEIYREEQFPEPEIPSLILKNNLYGIEIDIRAGALAAFALTMKAREKDKRFFNRKSKIENRKSAIQNPNICVLENIKIDPDDLAAYVDKVGRDLFTDGLLAVVNQWEEADNFGSLIRPLVSDTNDVLELLRERHIGQDLFLAKVHKQVLQALWQTDFLSPKYHVVVANPPYMGRKTMNDRLKSFAEASFKFGQADLFSLAMERFSDLTKDHGYYAMITMHSWMFLSSLEELRSNICAVQRLVTMAHLGTHAFDSIGGEVVATTAFVIARNSPNSIAPVFQRVTAGENEEQKKKILLESIRNLKSENRYHALQSTFCNVPGSPIAYWLSGSFRDLFAANPNFEEYATPRQGLGTTDNGRFTRAWYEISWSKIKFDAASHDEAARSRCKWFPYTKGGGFRKWFGNEIDVVNWENNGEEIRKALVGKNPNIPRSEVHYFKPGITWGLITSSGFSARHVEKGAIFDVGGSKAMPSQQNTLPILGLLNSNLTPLFLSSLNPTLNYQVGDLKRIPIVESLLSRTSISRIVEAAVSIAENDWAAYETSWDFVANPILANQTSYRLSASVQELMECNRLSVTQLMELETQCNVELIALYGLTNEVSSLVDMSRITLTCNPHFRYGSDKSELEHSGLLLADTMREFVSYGVGCMYGRYSLEKSGLILADNGVTVADYRKQIPEPKFSPDEDNVIPILDGDWFFDDISQRFKDFLKVTFGTEHYDENLEFLENSLYPDNTSTKKRKTIRDYFLKEFYDHHLKMYRKRPIYWLFSSPKGTFNALIYMHRYRPETVGKVLECLRDFREKLAHHAEQRQGAADSASESKAEKTKAVKDVGVIKKQLKELEDYEKTLFEVAAQKLTIDLDDGVKHNYLLFGSVLRKIPGLEAKED